MKSRPWLRVGACLIGAALLGVVLGTGLGLPTRARAQAGGSGNNLYAVDCASSSFCVTVGAAGMIWQYNGGGWVRQPGGMNSDLYDVACPSTSLCFAVGAAGTILQYNGSSWNADLSGSGSNLYGVTCAGIAICFAAGANGTLLQYNGSSWSVKPPFPPAPVGLSSDMADVTCLNPNLCFAVGGAGRIFEYDGNRWNTQIGNTGSALNSITCINTSLCFAVGAAGTILQYNGNSWTNRSSGTGNDLSGVTCVNASLCFAVGAVGAIFHYDGTGWSPVQPAVTTSYLSDVACPSVSLCFVAGAGYTILQYNGSAWSFANLFYPPPATPYIYIPPCTFPVQEYKLQACYPPGWNLVSSALIPYPVTRWFWNPSTSQYQQVGTNTQIPGSQGAWAYFTQVTLVNLGTAGSDAAVLAPLLGGQWQQVGDPFQDVAATICGFGIVAYTYDPIAGSYTQATTLKQGQGAWAYAQAAGTITFVPASGACPSS